MMDSKFTLTTVRRYEKIPDHDEWKLDVYNISDDNVAALLLSTSNWTENVQWAAITVVKLDQ